MDIKEEEKSNGAFIGLVIIIIILVVGGIYVWWAKTRQLEQIKMRNSSVTTTRETSIVNKA